MADIDPLQPTNDNDQALDFGKKKKKKKAKDDLLKDEAVADAIAPATDDKENIQAQPADGTAATTATEGGNDENLDFGKKKKPKKNVVIDEDQNDVYEFAKQTEDPNQKKEEEKLLSESDSRCLWQGSERDYTYDELLTRVYNIMREKNPNSVTGEKKRFVMKPPQVARLGTKKTSFSNFEEICTCLRRQEKHLLNFLLAELGTSGSLDSAKQLTIKGRFQQKQIENVLRHYIKEYVTCHTCHSPNTNMIKEERLFFLQCESCGSRCSVATIKSGFQAQVGKRAALRAKTT